MGSQGGQDVSKDKERFDEIQAHIAKTEADASWDRPNRTRVLKKLEALDTQRRIAVYYSRPDRYPSFGAR